jgi:pyrroline-5-carboxylate reductase
MIRSAKAFIFFLSLVLLPAGSGQTPTASDKAGAYYNFAMAHYYAEQSASHPAEMRNLVTSPGGTSAHALYQLEKGGFRTLLSKAVWAAFQRSVSLAALNSAVRPFEEEDDPKASDR